MDSADNKTPVKVKKPKSFKFLQKRDKEEKEDKREEKKRKEDKEDKKKEKKREKEEKKREKEKKKIKKERKKKGEDLDEDYLPVFGVPLSIAVDRQPSHDGVRLPVVLRECIDFIEEKGLHCEGIYRLGGVKSKIQSLRRAYNSTHPVSLEGQNPHVVACLLKQFLRELPETVLTVDMMPHFEDVSLIPNPKERSEAMRQLIDRLPTTNRLLLQYVLKHMGNVIQREKENKMTYQNICIVLSPTMQISHRVLNVMFLSHHYLFGNVVLKRYIPPLTSLSGAHVIEELRTSQEISLEMGKQESLLATLHKMVASGRDVSQANEERLWEAQRIVTLLKRKLKAAKRKENNCDSTHFSFLNQDKDLSSEDSQMEGSISEFKTANFENDGTSKANDATSASDAEYGTPVKSAPVECRSSKTSELDGDKGQECKKKEPPEISLQEGQQNEDEIISIQVTQESKVPMIPMLPKPISAKAERNKISCKAAEMAKKKTEARVTSQESSEGESPRRGSHVTVLSVGDAPDSMVQIEKTERMPKMSAETSAEVLPFRKASGESSQNAECEAILKEIDYLQFEHEELLSVNQDLTRRLQTEKVEIKRLREEIQEMQTLYGYRTHSYDSSESEGSESDGAESDSEEDIANQINIVNKANNRIQCENASLATSIQYEREKVIKLRVALRQAQTKAMRSAPQLLPAF